MSDSRQVLVKEEKNLWENYEKPYQEKYDEDIKYNLRMGCDTDKYFFQQNEVEIKPEVKPWNWWNQVPGETQEFPKDYPDLIKMEDIYRQSETTLRLNSGTVSGVGSTKVEDINNVSFEGQMLEQPEDLSVGREKPTNVSKPPLENTSNSKEFDCLACGYTGQCKCDFERHAAFHTDPLNAKLFKCVFCKRKERTMRSLGMHGNSVTAQKCRPCSFEPVSRNDLVVHLTAQNKSSDSDIFECNSCDDKTKRLHLPEYRNEKEISKCCLCDYKGSGKSDLSKHLLVHRDRSNLNLFKCFVCNHTTGLLGDLRLHTLEHESSKIPTPCTCKNKCRICSYRCESRGDLEEHLNDAHRDPPKSGLFKCPRCEYTTEHFSYLRMHFTRHATLSERKLFKCTVCDSKFVTKAALQMHGLLHLDPRHAPTFQCEACDFKSIYWCRMETHKLQHGSSSIPAFRCNFCVLEVNSESELKTHVETVHRRLLEDEKARVGPTTGEECPEGKVYKCDECPYEGISPWKLKYHKEVHKDRSERKLFECDACGFTYTSKAGLQTHTLLHMDPKERPMFRCDLCDYETIYRSRLSKHKVKHVFPPELAFTCNVCHLEFTSENQLAIHKRTVHPKPITSGKQRKDVLYKCSGCSYQTKDMCTMRIHEETHKDRSERELYECGTCGSKYTNKATLRQHVLLHVDVKDRPMFRCDECDYKTVYRSGLRLHKLKHTERRCGFCEWEGATKLELNVHLKMVHKIFPERKANSKPRPRKIGPKKYKCDECAFLTSVSDRLKRHKETHKERSQRQLFVCATCGASYTTKEAVQTHSFLHMDPKDRPTYDCDVCGYKTIYRSRMKSHKLMHATRSELVIRCSLCPMELNGESDFKVHLERFHSSSGRFQNKLQP